MLKIQEPMTYRLARIILLITSQINIDQVEINHVLVRCWISQVRHKGKDSGCHFVCISSSADFTTKGIRWDAL